MEECLLEEQQVLGPSLAKQIDDVEQARLLFLAVDRMIPHVIKGLQFAHFLTHPVKRSNRL